MTKIGLFTLMISFSVISTAQIKLSDVTLKEEFNNFQSLRINGLENGISSLISLETVGENSTILINKDSLVVLNSENYFPVKIGNSSFICHFENKLKCRNLENLEGEIEPYDIGSFQCWYGVNNGIRLSLINDSLYMGTTSLDFYIKSQVISVFEPKYYEISVLLSTPNNYLIESGGKFIFDGFIFDSSQIPDYKKGEFFFQDEQLYFFNGLLSRISISNGVLTIAKLKDNFTQLQKISSNLFTDNLKYFTLENGKLVSINIYPNDEKVQQIGHFLFTQQKRPHYATSSFNIKNAKTGVQYFVENKVLETRLAKTASRKLLINEYYHFEVISDSLIIASNFLDNQVYFIILDNKGGSRFFQKLSEGVNQIIACNENAEILYFNKKDLSPVLKEKSNLVEKKYYYRFSRGFNQGFILQKDSILFPGLNYSLKKSSRDLKDTILVIRSSNPVGTSIYNNSTFRNIRKDKTNSFHLFSIDAEEIVLHNSKNRTFKRIEINNYNILKNITPGFFSSYLGSIYFLKNDVLALETNKGVLFVLRNEVKEYKSADYGSLSTQNETFYFVKNNIHYILDENFNIFKEIKIEQNGGLSGNWAYHLSERSIIPMRVEFQNIYNDKSHQIEIQDNYLYPIGSYNGSFIFGGSNSAGVVQKLYSLNPATQKYNSITIPLKSAFYVIKMFSGNIIIFDSQNFKVFKYDIELNKFFEIQDILKYQFLGSSLKAKVNDEIFWISISNEELAIKCNELNEDSGIWSEHFDYFSEKPSYYFIANNGNGNQLYKSEVFYTNFDIFNWLEVKDAISQINTETSDIKMYPNPIEGDVSIFSDKPITQIIISSSKGDKLFHMSVNKGIFKNSNLEDKVNEFFKTQQSKGKLYIVEIETEIGKKSIKIIK